MMLLRPKQWFDNDLERLPAEDKQLEITPYIFNVIPDSYLSQIYRRTVREKVIYKTFYDGSVQNTHDFVDFVKNEKKRFYIVRYQGRDAGFFWLTEFVKKSAFINYCLFNEFWGKEGRRIGSQCLNAILHEKDQHDKYKLDVLLGLTPVTNGLAMNFLFKNGMIVIGKVPMLVHDHTKGGKVDAVLAYKLRDSHSGRLHFPNVFSMLK